jgi:hypothetical protein
LAPGEEGIIDVTEARLRTVDDARFRPARSHTDSVRCKPRPAPAADLTITGVTAVAEVEGRAVDVSFTSTIAGMGPMTCRLHHNPTDYAWDRLEVLQLVNRGGLKMMALVWQ